MVSSEAISAVGGKSLLTRYIRIQVVGSLDPWEVGQATLAGNCMSTYIKIALYWQNEPAKNVSWGQISILCFNLKKLGNNMCCVNVGVKAIKLDSRQKLTQMLLILSKKKYVKNLFNEFIFMFFFLFQVRYSHADKPTFCQVRLT